MKPGDEIFPLDCDPQFVSRSARRAVERARTALRRYGAQRASEDVLAGLLFALEGLADEYARGCSFCGRFVNLEHEGLSEITQGSTSKYACTRCAMRLSLAEGAA